jgi:hypothetical protein
MILLRISVVNSKSGRSSMAKALFLMANGVPAGNTGIATAQNYWYS